MSKRKAKQILPFLILVLIALLAMFIPPEKDFLPKANNTQYNSSDIAWVLVSTALVFLMTPGLALFYGGMVNRKNVIPTMIKSVVAAGIVGVLWIVCGFSLAFGESINGFIGDPSTYAFFQDVKSGAAWPAAPTIPLSLFSLFQLMFAIITPGLVVGAVAERIRFTSYVLFIVLFMLLVYTPVAHWSWHPEGILAQMGAWDYAGGTVVHITAGCAALAGALVLKQRKSHKENKEIPPANVPYVLIGTGLLWFGWFGFNAGSAVASDGRAGMAMAVTQVATATAVLTWMMVDWIRRSRFTLLGACSGAVAGLVAITPASGFVNVTGALVIGFAAGIFCYWGATGLKRLLGADDALDVFGIHGIGGIVGALLTGVLADKAIGGVEGDIVVQSVGVFATLIYSGIGTLIILLLVDWTIGLRVSAEDEQDGLDISQHAERVI